MLSDRVNRVYNFGEKPTVILYTAINRHVGTLTRNTWEFKRGGGVEGWRADTSVTRIMYVSGIICYL